MAADTARIAFQFRRSEIRSVCAGAQAQYVRPLPREDVYLGAFIAPRGSILSLLLHCTQARKWLTPLTEKAIECHPCYSRLHYKDRRLLIYIAMFTIIIAPSCCVKDVFVMNFNKKKVVSYFEKHFHFQKPNDISQKILK